MGVGAHFARGVWEDRMMSHRMSCGQPKTALRWTMTRLQGKYSRTEEGHEPVAFTVHYEEDTACNKNL